MERGRIPCTIPSVNVLIGATYLAELQARFGTWDLALTAYNHGPTAMRGERRNAIDDHRPDMRRGCSADSSRCVCGKTETDRKDEWHLTFRASRPDHTEPPHATALAPDQ